MELFHILINLCANVIEHGINSYCLKLLIGLLNTNQGNLLFHKSILSLISVTLNFKCHSEVFLFFGHHDSGLGIMTLKNLPKKGFCFCGFIRVERKDQSRLKSSNEMTIFKLSSSSCDIELLIKDGIFIYKVIYILI